MPHTAASRPVRSRRRTGPGFLVEFLRKPGQVGAIAPSSKHLAREITKGLHLHSAGVVVEYGPGSGAFTGHIRRRVGARTHFFAIEINPVLADRLRHKYPGLAVYEGSVAQVGQFLKEEGLPSLAKGGGVDVVISGLPWAIFPEKLQIEILDATMKVLKPGGTLVTFAYQFGLLSPAARRFGKLLPTYFSSITRSSLVWRNLPPAYVFRCVR